MQLKVLSFLVHTRESTQLKGIVKYVHARETYSRNFGWNFTEKFYEELQKILQYYEATL